MDTLGAVTYGVGSLEFSHADYMASCGFAEDAQYPGFGNGDPLEGFKRLLFDLGACDQFLQTDGIAIARAIQLETAGAEAGFAALR